MKGKIHISVKRARTIAHLDPRDLVHASDKLFAKAVRERERAASAERIETRSGDDLKFPSLGGGFMLKPDGREISGEDHFRLLAKAAVSRSYYFADSIRDDGRPRRRKRPTHGVHALAVLFRPDQASALAQMDGIPALRAKVKAFLVRCFGVVVQEFQAATGLEVLAGEIHPEEGCLHFHVVYASVSADNELLWQRWQRGRHGLRLLGPSHCGMLRLITAGFLPRSDGAHARHDLESRRRALNGDDPIDFRLAFTIDLLVERFASAPELAPIFAQASERYREQLNLRRAERPSALKAAKQKAEEERDKLAAEVASLKAELAAARNLTLTPQSRTGSRPQEATANRSRDRFLRGYPQPKSTKTKITPSEPETETTPSGPKAEKEIEP